MGYLRVLCLAGFAVHGARAVSLQAGAEAASRAGVEAAAAASVQARAAAMKAPNEMIGDVPWPELLEAGFKYEKPLKSGCSGRPEWAKTQPKAAGYLLPAHMYNVPSKVAGEPGWNGFCEMEMYSCPDAVANKDYYYYAKSLGTKWTKLSGKVDVDYCGNAGFLKPEIARITRNFTALTEKGEELCKGKFAEPQYGQSFMTVQGGIGTAMVTGFKNAMKETKVLIDEAWNTKSWKPLNKHIPLLNELAAGKAAAWNCGLGNLACDMAYCNWAYCEKPDGTRGMLEECEGWDPVKGMPGTYA